jgi:DNA-binding MarR family transcriptional regulator
MPEKDTPDERHEFTMPADRQQILGLSVNTLGRNIVWSLAQRTAKHGVLPGAYPIIAWLMQLSDSTQGELSRMIGIEQPTAAITLRRMERDDLIERSPDPEHGRRSRIRLTPHGRRLSKTIQTAASEVEKVASKGLSRAELQEFFRVVGIMIENLNAERYGRK